MLGSQERQSLPRCMGHDARLYSKQVTEAGLLFSVAFLFVLFYLSFLFVPFLFLFQIFICQFLSPLLFAAFNSIASR